MLDCFPEKCPDSAISGVVLACLTLGRTDHTSKMSTASCCCSINNLGELLGRIYMDDALILETVAVAVILLSSFLPAKVEYVSHTVIF